METFVYTESERPLKRQDLRAQLLGQGWFVHFSPKMGVKALVLEGSIRVERVFGARTKQEADRLRSRVLKGESPSNCLILAAPFEAAKDQVKSLSESKGPQMAAALCRSKMKYTIRGAGPLSQAIGEAVIQLTGGFPA